MKKKYLGVMIAGTIVGAAASMYSSNLIKPRFRRKLMRKGMRILKF